MQAAPIIILTFILAVRRATISRLPLCSKSFASYFDSDSKESYSISRPYKRQ